MPVLAASQRSFVVARGVFGNRRTGGVQVEVPVAGMAGETETTVVL